MRLLRFVIKLVASLLAVAIMVAIVGSVLSVLGVIGAINFGGRVSCMEAGVECARGNYAQAEVQKLEIDVAAASVKIKQVKDGDAIRFETDNRYVTAKVEDRTLKISEENHGWLINYDNAGSLSIYLREGVSFSEVKLKVGAGMLDVGMLSAREMKVELGAGKADLTLKVSGEADIDAGVGKLDLTMIGGESNYAMKINKGIGSITYQGENVKGDATFGTGRVPVKVDCGVGAVEIRMKNE